MPSLDLKSFLMQFSKLILVNCKKVKRPFEIFCLSAFICIRKLFLSYYLPRKSLADNKYESTKMQNSNVRISKHIKLHT